MHAARAIVTARGGMTSHAAVVARGMGRPCVSGAGDIRIDMKAGEFRALGRVIKKGETITVDGSSGEVLCGAADMVQPELTGDFGALMEWADGARRMKVRANAETPQDAATAVKFGAEGIGLCRTEHMFFDAERIAAVREMILAETQAARVARAGQARSRTSAQDFVGIFQVMGARPVTIRFLDPPLHEFLPHTRGRLRRCRRGHRARRQGAAGAREGAGREQSDARLPRLPAGDRLPGNLRHAGARGVRGGVRRGRSRARRRSRKS